MTRQSKRSTSAASGKYAVLVIKKVTEHFTSPYPVFNGELGMRDHVHDEWSEKKQQWGPSKRKPKTEWRKGPMTARLKLVDITSGSGCLPSLIFQNEQKEFALMTLDHFRTAVINRKLDVVDGMITGTFRFVAYQNYDYHLYLEVI